MARRILHFSRSFFFDSSNGASVANRALVVGLARQNFEVNAVCGTVVDAGEGDDPVAVFWASSVRTESIASNPPRLIGFNGGMAVTALHRPLHRYRDFDPVEFKELALLVEDSLDRFQPDVLVTYGGDPLTMEVVSRARRRGIVTVFTLHNFAYTHISTFNEIDTVLVPSRFSAEHHRRTLGLDCVVIPNLIDQHRVRTEVRDARYVTMVNPSPEKGVYAFSRIADELGRRRPDIPILVVEGRGTERTLADCGLDLRGGSVNLMAHTSDPRRFWAVTKVCLLPSLWWENQPLVAVEAMLNGIPVIGSDRGGIPETLGDAGIILPLPDRLTPSTRELPTPEEVAPWVEAIIRLWDDPAYYAEQSRRSLAESRRWADNPA
jgi:glycosyltransferase involved in cell wall biosynthesis